MNCPISALPASPKIMVNRFWMAVFQARAATRPKATVINSANLSRTSAVNFSSFRSCVPEGFSRLVLGVRLQKLLDRPCTPAHQDLKRLPVEAVPDLGLPSY